MGLLVIGQRAEAVFAPAYCTKKHYHLEIRYCAQNSAQSFWIVLTVSTLHTANVCQWTVLPGNHKWQFKSNEISIADTYVRYIPTYMLLLYMYVFKTWVYNQCVMIQIAGQSIKLNVNVML